ncbi:Fur-regulated basic protein FbpA [Edaphobacillus lindanitolerans]|uniref:Fur-regulated basic protein A n=1 Tax=Edaphobacillus lindanitolerans TaxID=550447 RepID=A0A1U7PQQ8_9BACI|nr:Fur-regulated basic protein FbpA [Edaphobacillus lindanitolerans]SIT93087.1 Fur-regulated basic protein A [Edaphobacillus lindanitolerans]
MKQLHESPMDEKKQVIIDRLVDEGVFKIDGKQLYELPIYALIKEYTERNTQ